MKDWIWWACGGCKFYRPRKEFCDFWKRDVMFPESKCPKWEPKKKRKTKK